MSIAINLDELAAAVAGHIKKTVPIEHALWDYNDIAEYLRRGKNTVQNRIAPRPDFPKAIRLDKKGHPLFEAIEIIEWAKKHKSVRGA